MQTKWGNKILFLANDCFMENIASIFVSDKWSLMVTSPTDIGQCMCIR
jgi:hypothetical protein